MATLSLELNVLTLNIWGIPFVSADRGARIDAIGQELNSGRYDIVSLQEVWSQDDCQALRTRTEAVLPHSHYFYSGVLGAGLLVLSKFPIIGTLFHAWSVNGYFHRIQHADWFGGKGVGLCRILVGDRLVHLYNAHLHAEYDNENDEYKTHRVIQAFDTAQFIRATRGNSVLQILAGDLNTKPHDISYKILLHTSKMSDSCTSESIATNECHRNSYTAKRSLARNPAGIRIDHIFIRSPKQTEALIKEYTLPFPERVPGQKFSYSDHEAVLVKLRLSARAAGAEAGTSGVCALTSRVPPILLKTNGGGGGDADLSFDIVAATAEQCAAVDLARRDPILQRISVLHESIALCDTSLQQLKVDRIYYYSIAVFLIFVLFALTEFPAPNGFRTIFLLIKFLVFALVLFSAFMGSIWNFMEQNGILSGKKAMEIMLRNTEIFELGLK